MDFSVEIYQWIFLFSSSMWYNNKQRRRQYQCQVLLVLTSCWWSVLPKGMNNLSSPTPGEPTATVPQMLQTRWYCVTIDICVPVYNISWIPAPRPSCFCVLPVPPLLDGTCTQVHRFSHYAYLHDIDVSVYDNRDNAFVTAPSPFPHFITTVPDI